MRKKFLCVLLSGAVALTGFTPVFGQSQDLSDIEGTPYEEAVSQLVDKGVITGYEDGTFRPLDPITRAEAAILIMNAMSPEEDILLSAPENRFTDMNGSRWASEAVNYALAMGFISGYPDGTFKPTQEVTYGEFTTMLVGALGYGEESLSGSWPDNYMEKGRELGLFDEISIRFTPASDNTQDAGKSQDIDEAQDADEKQASQQPQNETDAREVSQNEGDPQQTEQGEDALTSKDKAIRGDVALMVYPVLEELAKQGKNELPPLSEMDHTIVSGMDFTGDPIPLSMEEAITTMQTTGTRAQTALLNKQGDENTAKGLSQTTSSMSDQLDAAAGAPLSVSSALQSAGITSVNLKISRLRRDFVQDNIENNYQAELNGIEKDTVETYYGVLQAQENLKISQDNLNQKESLLELAQQKYDAGTAAKIDVTQAEAAVVEAQNSLQSAQSTLTTAKMNFNLLLGYPLMQAVEYTDTFQQLTPPAITLEEAIKGALDKRNEIVGASFNYQVQQIVLDNLRYTTSTASSAYREQSLATETAKTTLENLPSQIEMEIRTKYLNLQSMEEGISNARSTVSLAEEAFRVAQISYDAGLSTFSDVEEAQIAVYQAQLGLSSAIVQYDLAVYDFLYASDVGTTRLTF